MKTRRLDTAAAITEAILALAGEGVPPEQIIGRLVRLGPVDLDLLDRLLRRASERAAARADPAGEPPVAAPREAVRRAA